MAFTSSIREQIIESVRSAGRREIMPRFRNLAHEMIDTKTGPEDLVTIADKNAEDIISDAVRTVFPEAAIVGEEAVAENPSLLNHIKDADWCVIIDPIDGTWNYANGLTTFGTIIAVTYKGETVFGLLYDPVMDDWIMAEKGSGAFYCSADNAPKRLDVRKAAKGLTGLIPLFLFQEPRRTKLCSVLPSFKRAYSLRCSCHEYRLLSQAGVDFCISVEMKPWDHAAGTLIMEEAGGSVGLIDGRPYRPASPDGVLLSATHKDIFNEVVEILKPIS